MKVESAIDMYSLYLKDNARPHSIRTFKYTLTKFRKMFAGVDLKDVSASDVIDFISKIAGDRSPSTKNFRMGTIKAFFNFAIEATDANFQNPCMRPIVKKMFKKQKFSSPKLLDKDIIDETIFRTTDERNRLILELMGRFGMRISEVLNIRPIDINVSDSTLLIIEPKSGRKGEKVYIARKLHNKLQAYVVGLKIPEDHKIFDISYSTAYRMVRKSGKMTNSFLRPHDLRRHAITQASRNNTPIEIVSKVIARHSNIATTQRYLGMVDSAEASKWVERLNG